MTEEVIKLMAGLAEVKAKIEVNAVALASAQANRNRLEEDIEQLKKRIADEQKPKMRHGDYGFSPSGEGAGDQPRITLSCNNTMVTAGNGSVNNTNRVSNEKYFPNPVLGNIFDDLKAMSKDLTEFTLYQDDDDGLEVKLNKNGTITIKDLNDDESASVQPEEVHEFARKIQIMAATALRRQRNES